jgi:hypothetical protein
MNKNFGCCLSFNVLHEKRTNFSYYNIIIIIINPDSYSDIQQIRTYDHPNSFVVEEDLPGTYNYIHERAPG